MNKKKVILYTLITIANAFLPAIFQKEALCQVSVSPGTWITVKEGGSLMIDTDLHIKSVADSSGYFVDQTVDGDVTITGDITVDRYMAPDVWHNVSSPVSNETSSCFTGTDLVFWYNETQIWNDWDFGWIWYYGATGGPLMVFRGYDVYFDSDPVTVSYTATGSETLNTGSYNYNVTLTDPTPNPSEIPSHLGWNLAGNPYPSPVDWLAAGGWDKSDINDAKYIWDGINDVYTIFIGGPSPVGINGGTRYIPSDQGFWVQAVTNGSLGINNSTRIGNISGTPDFYKDYRPGYPLISLIVSGNGKSDEVMVRFIEGTTGGFDRNYDASKLFSPSDDVPQLSIRTGQQSLVLSTLPELKNGIAISLDFQCREQGIFNLAIGERTNLPDTFKLFLKDKMEDMLYLVNKDFAYHFQHYPTDTKERFILYINPSSHIINNSGSEKYFTVLTNGNRITIIKNNTEDMTGEIEVFNLLGQVIEREKYMNDEVMEFMLDAPGGEYLIRIITKGYIFSSKIIINKN